ncbi:hypothetical protein [uncultured Desulfosarcina sp.]|uniref:hypothetical protein n=1 Tax=uncultured Desulfosarcina sp. TaxID=218289 RepID=UPI0029C930D7|nr:hypothetical protein [uncultured Desulfosarcina sp.]
MDTVSIKIWLLKNGYTQKKIAQDIGIIPQTVWKTINGRENNRQVLAWLERHGALKEAVGHE